MEGIAVKARRKKGLSPYRNANKRECAREKRVPEKAEDRGHRAKKKRMVEETFLRARARGGFWGKVARTKQEKPFPQEGKA